MGTRLDSDNKQRSCGCLTSVSWTSDERVARRHPRGTSDQRHEFERDRDRILYSSAFHRLAGITQIVRAGEANVFHTRYQHTVKVAQVGRRLAQKLIVEQEDLAKARGLDPEVVEAACLAHDLGHPPFGHIGESVLDELVSKTDDDGFEGNAQSFRIVTKLAVRFPDFDGINLTRATLAACLKYPWFRNHEGKKHKKRSVYQSEKADFDFAREFHDHSSKTLEAELMDWADDVAYSVHDLEDFHRCNALPWQRVFSERDLIIDHALGTEDATPARRGELESAYERLNTMFTGTYESLLTEAYTGEREQREQLRRMTSHLIGMYIKGVTINPDPEAPVAVVFDQERRDEISILKQITRDYIIGSPTLAAQQHGQELIIDELYQCLFEAKDVPVGGGIEVPKILPIRLRYLKSLSGTSRARFVADCISSLSEAEAISLHGRLTGVATGSVLDPIVR